MNAGTRYRSQVCSTEVIVIKPADVELWCGGHPMVGLTDQTDPGATLDPSVGEPALIGKRYTDAGGELEILVTKPGLGALATADAPLAQRQAKTLPSSD